MFDISGKITHNVPQACLVPDLELQIYQNNKIMKEE